MGPGTVLAARRGARVLAIDPTPFMRRVLGVRRLLQRQRAAIDVRDGAAESIPTADGSVDAIWAVNSMHHWTDPKGAAAEIVRVLQPDGRVVLVDENFDDPRHELHEEMADRHADHDHDHGLAMVDVDEFAELLAEAGLVEVESASVDLGGQPVLRILAHAPS